jgi:hypothetical protein
MDVEHDMCCYPCPLEAAASAQLEPGMLPQHVLARSELPSRCECLIGLSPGWVNVMVQRLYRASALGAENEVQEGSQGLCPVVGCEWNPRIHGQVSLS